MDSNPIVEIIDDALCQKMFTGGAIIVIRNGLTILERYFGTLGLSDDRPVDNNTLFDLASLTKVLATTPCWMKILEEKPDLLDSPLTTWFSQLDSDKRDITPRLLMAHSSGLPAWRPYYLYDKGSGHQAFVVERILGESMDYPLAAGSLYSDLGFILLGQILEHELKQRLDIACNEVIYAPLRLSHQILFTPSRNDHSIAQTRSGDLSGFVNDLNARVLGGVSGHAGLFGTCRGVAELASEFLKSFSKPGGFFDHEIIKLFVERCRYVPESSRALGFDTKSEEGSSCGSLFSESSFGHTGFTGTSLWVDPARGVVVVFLTNRVVMGEPDLRIKSLRPILHNLIIQRLDQVASAS